MCAGGNIYGIVTLLVGIGIMIFLNIPLLKKESTKNFKWKIIIADFLLIIIIVCFYRFFSSMWC